MKKNKKGMDGSWFNNTTSSTTTNNLPMTLLGIGGSLLVIYGIVWVASKAWSKGEA